MFRKTVVAVLGLVLCAGAVFAEGKQEAALGTQDNPIVWVYVPSGDTQKISAGATAVADLLHEKTGLYFKTVVATDYPGAIEALRSNPPSAQMASLATFAAIAAIDADAIDVALVAIRNGAASYSSEIIVGANAGITSMADLKGKTFARPDPISTSGWIVPMIKMKASGLNPDTDLKVVDAGGHTAVVSAVYNGDAAAGACFVDARSLVQSDHSDVMDKVKVLTTIDGIPNDGVQFQKSVPQDIRDKVVNAILEIAQTDAGKTALNEAYQWTGLEKHDNSFYEPFRQLLKSAGVDPAKYM
jgi:phosphonate transport system substrate-binding protein